MTHSLRACTNLTIAVHLSCCPIGSGIGTDTSNFSIYYCEVELTVAGLSKIDEIIEVFFDYVTMLKGGDDARWRHVYKELSEVAEMNFRFKAKEGPFNYTSKLASNMWKFPPEKVLSEPWLYGDFDATHALKHIRNFLAGMVGVARTRKLFFCAWHLMPYLS